MFLAIFLSGFFVVVILFLFCSEMGSHTVARTSMKLTMWPSFLSLPYAGIVGVRHHALLIPSERSHAIMCSQSLSSNSKD